LVELCAGDANVVGTDAGLLLEVLEQLLGGVGEDGVGQVEHASVVIYYIGGNNSLLIVGER